MKIAVQISESELKAIRRLTGGRKKGPAIRRVVTEALNMAHRREIADKFMSGELGIEAEGYEESRAADRAAAKLITLDDDFGRIPKVSDLRVEILRTPA